MNKATLFRVEEELIWTTKNYHEFYSVDHPFRLPDKQLGATFETTKAKVHRWPIERVYVKEDGDLIVDQYICMDPRLRQMLEVPIRTEWERSLVASRNMLEHMQDIACSYQERLRLFNEAPWWKRVWITLKGAV